MPVLGGFCSLCNINFIVKISVTDFIPRKDYQEIEKEYKDTVEKTYRLMLRWKREETNGLLQLKNLAEKLRSIRHPEIAEQLEP